MAGLLFNAFSRGPEAYTAGVKLRTEENTMRRQNEIDQRKLEQARRVEAADKAFALDAAADLNTPAPDLSLPVTGADGRIIDYVKTEVEQVPVAPAPAAPKRVAGVTTKPTAPAATAPAPAAPPPMVVAPVAAPVAAAPVAPVAAARAAPKRVALNGVSIPGFSSADDPNRINTIGKFGYKKLDPNASDVARATIQFLNTTNLSRTLNFMATSAKEPLSGIRKPLSPQDEKRRIEEADRASLWYRSAQAFEYFKRNPEMLPVAQANLIEFRKKVFEASELRAGPKPAAPAAAAPAAAAAAAPAAAAAAAPATALPPGVQLLRNNLAATNEDLDYLVRTVHGEAGAYGPMGQVDVANLIINRAIRSGQSIKQVVLANNGKTWQFEPWGNPDKRREMQSLSPAQYKRIADALQPAIGPSSTDTVNGATLMYAPIAQQQLGRKKPNWAIDKNMVAQRGGHNFYTGAFKSDQRRRTGLGVPKTQPTAEEVSSPTAFTEQAADPATAPQVFERWQRVLLSDRNRPSREIDQHLQKRKNLMRELEYLIETRNTSGIQAKRIEIQSLDNNMIMLKGMDGFNLAREGSPEVALAVLSKIKGATYQLVQRSDNSVTVLKDGQPVNGMVGIDYNKNFLPFLGKTFSDAFAAAAAAFDAETAKIRFQTNEDIRKKAAEQAGELTKVQMEVGGRQSVANTQGNVTMFGDQLRARTEIELSRLGGIREQQKAILEARLKAEYGENVVVSKISDTQYGVYNPATGQMLAVDSAKVTGPDGKVIEELFLNEVRQNSFNRTPAARVPTSASTTPAAGLVMPIGTTSYQPALGGG